MNTATARSSSLRHVRKLCIPGEASPRVVLETLPIRRGGTVTVVRDDLLPGGTKQRALRPLLTSLVDQGAREMVYASPFCGYAQVALAAACAALSVPARIFCVEDAAFPGGRRLHPYAVRAQNLGAQVEIAQSLADAEQAAEAYAAGDRHRHQLPLGFACPEFHLNLRLALGEQWKKFTHSHRADL